MLILMLLLLLGARTLISSSTQRVERSSRGSGGAGCRACGTGETKAHPVGTLLLCDAENCTAAWHTKCLGLRSVPSGNWECPCCAHAPGKKCMPQWPPVPKRSAKSGKKPAANYLAEEESDGGSSGEE